VDCLSTIENSIVRHSAASIPNAMLEASRQMPLKDLAYNQSIRDLLRDLAVLSPQLGPNELCSMWFDDLYFPGQSLPAKYPCETWERGQLEWKACFNSQELEVLAKFHEVFDSKVDALPVTGQWQQDLGWQGVSKAARAALNGLELCRSNIDP
jgi:hypothetical protein